MNSLLIAYRNVMRDRIRVMNTLLIIAVGLTAVLLGGGFMLSSYDALQEISMRTEGHIIIVNENDNPVAGGVSQQLDLQDWQAIQDVLWEDERVLRILPRARFEGLIRHGQKSAVFFGTGVDPQEEFRVYGPFLRTTGELNAWLSPDAVPEVVLGKQLARTVAAQTGDELGLHTLKEDGQVSERVVRLAGVYQTGVPEIDDHTLMVSLSTASSLLHTDRVSQLSVYLNQREDAVAMQQELQSLWPGVTVMTWHQRAELYDKVKAQYDRIFGVMGIIILVVAFLAITNTIAMAVSQRREEIATLNALGTPSWRIYAGFVMEACLIAIMASLLGMLCAYVMAYAINNAGMMMPAPPGRTEGYPIVVYVSWPHYITTSLVFIVIVILAALLASYNTAKAKIAEALS